MKEKSNARMQTPAVGISAAHDEATCYKHGGSSTCCSEIDMACSDGYGWLDSCESQFDAIGCHLSRMILYPSNAQQLEEPCEPQSGNQGNIGDKLYRLLLPDENPQGIVAKDASALRTVRSRHVNCFWTSPEVTRKRERQGV